MVASAQGLAETFQLSASRFAPNWLAAMQISALVIRNFRLIENAVLSLTPGIQLFLGDNAQGKTSLIEAIFFLSTSTSHRTRREEELIQWNCETAYLRGTVEQHERTETLECGLERQRKQIKADEKKLPRVGDLYGRLRTVLFAPEDLQIVSGSPQERRRFLDMAIAQVKPEYIHLLQQYRRVLRQRNQALKQIQIKGSSPALLSQVSIWNDPFIDLAAQIVQERAQALQSLSQAAENYYAGLADDGPFQLRYAAAEVGDDGSLADKLRDKLERSQQSEQERGSTQTGPHRDDLQCLLQGRPLASTGSQGQRRAAALALRLAESGYCREQTGDWPILLIDDVVYEMDNHRRTRFWQQVDTSGQLIVTATDREHLGASLEPSRVFGVSHGKIHLTEP